MQEGMTDYDTDGDKTGEESYKDEETLRRLYHDEELTQSEIGEQFDVTGAAVSYWMDEFGIEPRSELEAARLNDEDIPYRDEDTLRKLYHDKKMTVAEMAEKFGCSKWPVNKWMDEFGIERRDPSEFQQIRWDDEADHEPITEEWLRELYVECRLSPRSVAEEIGCGRQKIVNRLEECEIEQRSQSAAARIRNSREPVSHRVQNGGYKECRTWFDGEQYSVLVHRLAAVAWFGWDAVADNHVHHKNGFKRDNREENLETMPASDHIKLHHEQGDYS